MAAKVELIYDQNCPNVSEARRVLREAFDTVGAKASWKEWDRENPKSPPHARGYGSPTILVNGKDVVGQESNTGQNCCRVYSTATGRFHGVPPLDEVVSALNRKNISRFRWGQIFGTAPGIGASLLPVGLCPGCWPVYAGVLSSLGLGFLLYSTYLLPVTAAFLVFSLGTLAHRAEARRGYRPFVLGLLAAVGILVGKFGVSSDVLFYSSAAVFVGAALWNAWPKAKAKVCSYDTCAMQE